MTVNELEEKLEQTLFRMTFLDAQEAMQTISNLLDTLQCPQARKSFDLNSRSPRPAP